MTKEDLAKKLNGRQLGDEIYQAEEKLAEENGLVVVFGASDDLIEFRGAINGEAGCYDGGAIPIDRDGIIEKLCDSDDCPHDLKRVDQAKNVIHAVWCEDGFSWAYKTDIPHATFEIREGSESYCRGIVFSIGDLL